MSNDLRILRNRPIFRGRRRNEPSLRMRANLRRFLASNRTYFNVFLSGDMSSLNTSRALSDLLTPYVMQGEIFILNVGERHYTVTPDLLLNLYDSSNFIANIDFNNPNGSDEEILAELNIHGSFSLQRRPMVAGRVQGSFFKYLNNTDMNLECLGIFKSIDKNNYKDNCLTYALKEAGLNEIKLNRLRTLCQHQSIPRAKLTEICNILNIKIALKTVKENNEDDRVRCFPSKNYKNNKNQEFKLCCYDNHYFINKLLPYRKYHINKLINGKLNKNINDYKVKDNLITSYSLVKLLLKHKDKLLKKITYNYELLKTVHFEKVKDIVDLTYEDNNFKDTYKDYLKKKKNDNKYHKVFFDFETYRDVDNINKPYLCCYVDENNKKKTFIGEDCGYQLLQSIPDNSLLIAHNASFDINFIIHYLYQISIIKKGRKIISVRAKFMDKNILVKDSYLLISMPLRKFGSCFNLEQHKEVMVYRLYDKYFQDNNKNKYIPLEDVYKELNNKENEKLFYENCEKWKLLSNDKKGFDIIKYSAIYCMIDCEVLMKGYNRFREWILNLDFDIDNILTLASLADQYFIKNECYNEVYKISGIAREFIQKSVVGGRCMVAKNKRYKLKNCKMADFDAVSLYPSAMKRLQTELGGFLKGKPKILKNLTYDFLKHCDGYFIEIKITDVRIYRDFPLMSNTENSIRNFTNEMVGKIMFVDRITLEDLIKYHDIDFEIIRGYYYNEGRNNKIGESIEHIFNERLKKKKEKNPAQLVYKLLMNSAYGKTILNPITEDIVSFTTNEKEDALTQVEKYINKNYSQVKYYEKINKDHYFVLRTKSILEHFSRPQVGTEILSMSKRIMNEVMTTAEDNEMQIYYTDTDSMHILYNDVYKLEKIFNKKYGRELIGKNLGQFHVDFSLDGVPKENEHTIYAKNCIFLGKKTYIDQLVGLDKDGKEINGMHVRAKGIPNSAIKYECKKRNINEYELYEKLFNGEKIEFDLLENGNKINLTFDNFVVKNTLKFTRSMHFI